MNEKIDSNENVLIGNWILNGLIVEGDAVTKRIRELTSNYLIRIGSDESGWNILYQDPEDLRYWELTYPDSYLQGGGPSTLKNISEIEVSKIYQL